MRREREGASVSRQLAAVRRRITLLHAAVAFALGLTVTASLHVLLRLAGGPRWILAASWIIGAIVAGVGFTRRAPRRTTGAVAAAIERSTPQSRNIVITAEELLRHPDRAEPSVVARVFTVADTVISGVKPASVIPARRFAFPVSAVIASAAIILTLVAHPATLPAAIERIASAITGADAGDFDVTVTVTPPAYLGATTQEVRNPKRLDAVEGSRITFAVAGQSGVRIRFGDVLLPDDGREHVVSASGYFVVETPGSSQRRFIPLAAVPDRAPSVRIETPGKDLLLPAGDRTVPINVSASDDAGLRTLELRFMKVTGSGEQFEFEEGSLPVTLERSSAREWRASGRLSLSSLKLGAGDSLVYRAVSRDGRPGDAGLASSDTYFIEIVGEGQIPVEGIDMPPELERYGMSQQMIVLKLERLRADERSMAREALVEQLASIAAEQRTVRANFIFLLGGHVEDEFEEAEASHEIQEGRLENTARRDINVAIAHMTRAEQGMTAVNTAVALGSAREAVGALQRAFGRNRYLLRSLATRSRLDPARRLTGDLSGAGDWRRTSEAADEPKEDAIRSALDGLLQMAGRWSSASSPTPLEIEALAERLLNIDRADQSLAEASQRLLETRTAPAATAALRAVEQVAAVLVSHLEGHGLPRTNVPPPASRLRKLFDMDGGR